MANWIFYKHIYIYTLPEANSSPLKMDGWNTILLLGWPIFRCELLVSGRVDTVNHMDVEILI